MSPVVLAVTLAFAAPPAPWEPHAAECISAEETARTDANPGPRYAAAADACRQAYESVPTTHVGAADLRSYYVFEAVRLYKLAHDKDASTDLSAAAAMLESYGATVLVEQVQEAQDVAAALAEIEARRPRATDDLAPVGMSPLPRPEVESTAPQSALAVQPSPAAKRPRRPYLIAGSTVTGVAVALGFGAVGAAIRGAILRTEVAALNATYGSGAIPPSAAVDPADGPRMDAAATGLAIAAGALLASGAVLFGVHAFKSRRPALQPVIGPTAGIRISLSF